MSLLEKIKKGNMSSGVAALGNIFLAFHQWKWDDVRFSHAFLGRLDQPGIRFFFECPR